MHCRTPEGPHLCLWLAVCEHMPAGFDASTAGTALTECCGHRFKLGRVLWELGGSYREDPDQAQTQFESASMEECDSQVGALSDGPQASLHFTVCWGWLMLGACCGLSHRPSCRRAGL